MRYTFGRHLRATLSYNYQKLEVAGGTLFTANLTQLNPQTVFFLGYSDNSQGDQRVDLTRADRTFFAKIGYAWVP